MKKANFYEKKTNDIKDKIFIICLVFFISIFACNEDSINKANSVSKLQDNKEQTENFDDFFDLFHKDSLFQMLRIKFPLEGSLIDENGEKKWTRKNWCTLKTKISDIDTTEYKIFINKTDSTYIEKFWIEDSGFFSEYRFKLIKNKWYLVYAKDCNM